MRRSLATLAAVLLLTVSGGAGCVAHPHRGFLSTSIDLDAVRKSALEVPADLASGKRRLPRIAVAPVHPTATARPRQGERKFDARVLDEEIVALLRASGAFEGVTEVGRDRAAPDFDRDEQEARDADAAFLLRASVIDPSLRLLELSPALSVALWVFPGFPALWIHDHSYALSCGLRFQLVELGMGEGLPEPRIAPAYAKDELCYHERTDAVWGYLLTYVWPTFDLPQDDDVIARALAPRALGEPVSQLLAAFDEALKGESYRVEVEKEEGGAAIRVGYPTGGKRLFLAKRAVRCSVMAEARPDTTIREVRVGPRTVFPSRGKVGAVAWRAVPIEWVIEPGGAPLTIQVIDSSGRASRCKITSIRE